MVTRMRGRIPIPTLYVILLRVAAKRRSTGEGTASQCRGADRLNYMTSRLEITSTAARRFAIHQEQFRWAVLNGPVNPRSKL